MLSILSFTKMIFVGVLPVRWHLTGSLVPTGLWRGTFPNGPVVDSSNSSACAFDICVKTLPEKYLILAAIPSSDLDSLENRLSPSRKEEIRASNSMHVYFATRPCMALDVGRSKFTIAVIARRASKSASPHE